jgi:DNA-binding transcriptional ArsR family regulator
MIEFVLSEPDLAGVRFAISPLNELTLSLRVLKDPGRYPNHLRWLRGFVDEVDLPVLTGLTNDRGWTPDFLSPRPESPLTGIEEELDQLAATPAATVRRDLRAIGTTPMPLPRIIDALGNYWRAGFAGNWHRMRSVLEADIAYRGRKMTRSGLGAMVTDISDRITFDSPVVGVRIHGVADRRIEVRGAGLTLMPSLFARHTAVPVSESGPPMLIYAARGVATLWERQRERPPDALVNVLGRVRAELMASLDEPVSSTELAGRLGVTASAVNQHLRALRDAGLLASRRHGRSVLYLRTELGDAFVTR